jgi:hypothetical protein
VSCLSLCSLSTKKRVPMTLEAVTSSTAVTAGGVGAVGAAGAAGAAGAGAGAGAGALGSIVRRQSRPKKFSISKLFHRDKAGRLKLVDRSKSDFSTGGERNSNGNASATVTSTRSRSTVMSSDAFSPHLLDQVPEEGGEIHPNNDDDSPHAVLLHNPQLYHNDVTLSETATFRKRPRRRLRFRNSITTGANANANVNVSLSMSWFSQLEWFKRMSHWAFDVVDSDQSGHIDEQELYSGLLLIHLKLGTYAGPAACKVGFGGRVGLPWYE